MFITDKFQKTFCKIESSINKHPLAFLILTNTGLMLFCVFILNFHYETNDDPAIVALLSGAYGTPDYHVEYMSSCLGAVLSTLFTLNPYFNWHTLMLLSLAYISFNIIFYVLFLIRDDICTIYPYTIALAFLLAPCYYTVLQFTRVPEICIISGFLLILTNYELSICSKSPDSDKPSYSNSKTTVIRYIIAGAIIVLGSMVRFSMLYTIGLIFTPVFLITIIRGFKSFQNRYYIAFITTIIVTGCLCLFFNFLDKSNYSDGDYKYWSDYSDEEVELMDHGWPDYDANRDLYESLEISENSYTNYILWDFDDPNYINVDSMKKLIDAKEYCVYYLDSISDINWSLVWQTWLLYLSRLYKYYFFPLLIAGILLVFFFKTKQKWLTLSTILMIFVAELFLAFMQRGLMARIDIGLFTAVIFLCIFLYRNNASDFPIRSIRLYRTFNLIFAICIITFIVSFSRNQLAYREYENGLTTKQHLFNLACNDKDHTYIYSTLDSVPISFDMWRTKGIGYQDNLFSLGGWTAGSPAKENQKKMRGINNLFADMVDRDDVFYIVLDSDVNLKLDYIKEHYNENIKAIPCKRLYGATLYKIVSEDNRYPSSHNLKKDYVNITEAKNKGIKISFGYELIESDASENIGLNESTPLTLLGTAIVDGTGDSYSQEIIISIKNKQGNTLYYPAIQIVNDDYLDGNIFRYTKFVYDFTATEAENLDFDSVEFLIKLPKL